MNAISLLNSQHDELDALFAKADSAGRVDKKKLFAKIADALAMHATIEEKIFYPAVKAKATKDMLLESLEEHLAMKRVIADLLEMSPSDDTFEAKLTVLKEEVQHHVKEEKSDLFPKVRKLMDKQQLEVLGEQMEVMMGTLEGTEPRREVPKQTARAAPLP